MNPWGEQRKPFPWGTVRSAGRFTDQHPWPRKTLPLFEIEPSSTVCLAKHTCPPRDIPSAAYGSAQTPLRRRSSWPPSGHLQRVSSWPGKRHLGRSCQGSGIRDARSPGKPTCEVEGRARSPQGLPEQRPRPGPRRSRNPVPRGAARGWCVAAAGISPGETGPFPRATLPGRKQRDPPHGHGHARSLVLQDGGGGRAGGGGSRVPDLEKKTRPGSLQSAETGSRPPLRRPLQPWLCSASDRFHWRRRRRLLAGLGSAPFSD